MVVCGVSEEETLRGYDATPDRSLAFILTVLLVAGLAAWCISRVIRRTLASAGAACDRGSGPGPRVHGATAISKASPPLHKTGPKL